ncbi:MAG: SDR family oxidoreductase [Planctomycetota bacterium]|jgi:enoyl-[acyl-carrier protein] reductase I|nr:SDR family oxidoreductase [Planctomycetota bacterium]
MSFLGLAGKTFLVAGVANRKSVAWHIASGLLAEGAEVVLSVRDAAAERTAAKLFPGADILICDMEREEDLASLPARLGARHPVLAGLVHSIAFANYSRGLCPFHETRRADFLQAVNVSMFSLVALANACRDLFARDASVVTISISHTSMASESYGYMAPVKAALDASVAFLAKSFSAFSEVRFNAVNAGLLKTASSAGIPGYLDNYLFAEKATLRKRALETREVADLALFLLSPRSSGINAQRHVVDAGMSVNFFDQAIVKRAVSLD